MPLLRLKGYLAKTDKLDALLLEQYALFVSDTEKGDEILSDIQDELKALKAVEIDLQI